MTNLAKNAAATLLAIVHPVIRRQMPSIDAVIQRERLRDRTQERLHLDDHWRKSAVETDHQGGTIRRLDVQISGDGFSELLLRQAQRLFAEDILLCPQRRQNLP